MKIQCFYFFTETFAPKIEMNIFSRTNQSIDLFEGYKTVYFRFSKKFGHLDIAWQNYDNG